MGLGEGAALGGVEAGNQALALEERWRMMGTPKHWEPKHWASYLSNPWLNFFSPLSTAFCACCAAQLASSMPDRPVHLAKASGEAAVPLAVPLALGAEAPKAPLLMQAAFGVVAA